MVGTSGRLQGKRAIITGAGSGIGRASERTARVEAVHVVGCGPGPCCGAMLQPREGRGRAVRAMMMEEMGMAEFQKFVEETRLETVGAPSHTHSPERIMSR